MRTVLAELRTRYDVIVVDTPPLLPVADGAVASAWADGVVLLVRTAKTPSHQVELSLRSLSSVGARLVGAVMTMTPTGSSSRYTSYDYRAGDGPRPDRTGRAELAVRPGSRARPRRRIDRGRQAEPDPAGGPPRHRRRRSTGEPAGCARRGREHAGRDGAEGPSRRRSRVRSRPRTPTRASGSPPRRLPRPLRRPGPRTVDRPEGRGPAPVGLRARTAPRRAAAPRPARMPRARTRARPPIPCPGPPSRPRLPPAATRAAPGRARRRSGRAPPVAGLANRSQAVPGRPAAEPAGRNPVTSSPERTVRILGTHGVPAAYGGFETAAEHVARYLRRPRAGGSSSTASSRAPGRSRTDEWEGMERVLVPIPTRGLAGHLAVRPRHRAPRRPSPRRVPDVRVQHRRLQHLAAAQADPQRHQHGRHRVVPARDGGRSGRGSCGPTSGSPCVVGDHLIADHPEIARYLRAASPGAARSPPSPTAPTPSRRPRPRRSSPSGSSRAVPHADRRPIPENSILELVHGVLGSAARASSGRAGRPRPPRMPTLARCVRRQATR